MYVISHNNRHTQHCRCMYQCVCSNNGRLFYFPDAVSLHVKGLWVHDPGMSCNPTGKALLPPFYMRRACKSGKRRDWPERISSGSGGCSLSRVTTLTSHSSAVALFKPVHTSVINRNAQPFLLRNRAETVRWLCVCAPRVVQMGTAGCRSLGHICLPPLLPPTPG